jgi:hypothetical protein
MSKVTVEREGPVGASAEVTYRLIAEDEHHRHFLPDSFSDFEVVEGGTGAGSLHRFKVRAGGRTRQYTMRVSEPEPGRVITETDQDSSLVTNFTVKPLSPDSCRVLISTSWDGAGGVGGFFERLFAPRVMRRTCAEELSKLDRYARGQTGATA